MKADLSSFHFQVLAVDGYKCMAVVAGIAPAEWATDCVQAHHIDFGRKKRNNSISNGITLSVRAHYCCHHGGVVGGVYYTAREYITLILRTLLDRGKLNNDHFRWQDGLEKLERKYGNKK